MSDSDERDAQRSLARALTWLERFEDLALDESGRIDRFLGLRRGELKSDAPPEWAHLHADLNSQGRQLERGLERLLGDDLPAEISDSMRGATDLLADLRLALYDVDFDGDPRERYRFDRELVHERVGDASSSGVDVGGSCPVPGCSETKATAKLLLEHFREHPRYRDGDFLLHPGKHRARVLPALAACQAAVEKIRKAIGRASSLRTAAPEPGMIPTDPESPKRPGRRDHPWKQLIEAEDDRWRQEGLHAQLLKSVRAERLISWALNQSWAKTPDGSAPSARTVERWILDRKRSFDRQNSPRN